MATGEGESQTRNTWKDSARVGGLTPLVCTWRGVCANGFSTSKGLGEDSRFRHESCFLNEAQRPPETSDLSKVRQSRGLDCFLI